MRSANATDGFLSAGCRLQDLAQHVATVARKRPHLSGPAPELHGLRPSAAGKHLGAFQLVIRAVARLALGNDGVLLAPDEHGERDAHRTSYREHARHLEKLRYVLRVIDLVEQRLLRRIDVHACDENELRFSCHASLLYLRREALFNETKRSQLRRPRGLLGNAQEAPPACPSRPCPRSMRFRRCRDAPTDSAW